MDLLMLRYHWKHTAFAIITRIEHVSVQLGHISIGDWKDIYSSFHYHLQIGSIHFSHCYNIFSVVVCLRCLLHHILSLIAYTFRENRQFVFNIIVQFMMSANGRICFVCTVHHLIIIIVQNYLKTCTLYVWNACQMNFVECVSKIKHILSVIRCTIHYTICGAVCFQFTQSSCDDWDNIYTLSYYHHQIGFEIIS